MLLAGSREPHVYDEKDVTFLSLVANQVALAIDNALNYEARPGRRCASNASGHRNLEASDAAAAGAVAGARHPQVFPRISEITSTVLPHDLLTLMFHDGPARSCSRRRRDDAGVMADAAEARRISALIDDAFTIIDELATRAVA